jgi:hypothetical protein
MKTYYVLKYDCFSFLSEKQKTLQIIKICKKGTAVNTYGGKR